MSDRIPVGTAELWMQFNALGDPEPMFTAFGLDLAGFPTPGQVNTDALLTIVRDTFDSWNSVDYTVGPGHILWGAAVGTIRIDGSIAAVAGTLAGASVVQNTAHLVRKFTAEGGRRGRGRMYVPTPTETNVNAIGVLLAAYITSRQAELVAMQTALAAHADVDGLALLHDSAPFTPTPITSLVLQQVVATQRRRLRR